MRCAVERRVLDEVREAELVVRLEDGTGVDHEPQFGAILGLLVLADVILEAVRERPDSDFRVYRQGRGQIRRRRRRRFCRTLRAGEGRGQGEGERQNERSIDHVDGTHERVGLTAAPEVLN